MLAACASALNDAGYLAFVFDRSWRCVYATAEVVAGSDARAAEVGRIGCHWADTAWINDTSAAAGYQAPLIQEFRDLFRAVGPFMLATVPGGRERLRQLVDPGLSDLVDQLEPVELPPIFTPETQLLGTQDRHIGALRASGAVGALVHTWVRIDADDGDFAGVAMLLKPAIGMSHLVTAAAFADAGLVERMQLVQRPDRRPAAILFADLEASSPLARRLSTAQYFTFGRRLVQVADRCVIDEGGIVGRHVGDGVAAFFLVDTAGSESAAARACIAAARALRGALAEVVTRSDIPSSEVVLRFGLHWGATVYIGRILTAGRSEVTALGDEVNETARIEACATGGRALASKALIERLNHADADALGLEPNRTTYIPLAELPTATDKARRDAPSIAVCEL